MEPGTRVTGKDHQAASGENGGGVPPQHGGGNHLALCVIDPEAAGACCVYGHGFPGGGTHVVPAGIAVILDGGIGPACPGEENRCCCGVHVKTVVGGEIGDAVFLVEPQVLAIPTAYAG